MRPRMQTVTKGSHLTSSPPRIIHCAIQARRHEAPPPGSGYRYLRPPRLVGANGVERRRADPLDRGRHRRLVFRFGVDDDISIAKRLRLDGEFQQPVKEQAALTSVAPVEPERELVEIR